MTDLLYCAISGLFTAGGCAAAARTTACVCELRANQNKIGVLIQEPSLMGGSEPLGHCTDMKQVGLFDLSDTRGVPGEEAHHHHHLSSNALAVVKGGK